MCLDIGYDMGSIARDDAGPSHTFAHGDTSRSPSMRCDDTCPPTSPTTSPLPTTHEIHAHLGAVPPEFVHSEFSQTQIPAPPPEASHIPDRSRRPQRTQTHPPDCGTGHGETSQGTSEEKKTGMIKLSAYSSFSLFECRKVVAGSKSPDPGNEIVSYSGLCCHAEEYIRLDDNKYIGDLLVEFKAAKDRSKGEILHCKLTFKKKLFRASGEAVTDPMFVQLSYVQLQHDYILGNYPVGRDDAAQLSALQILVEIGFVDTPESCTDWNSLLERFLPRQIAITRAKREWELDILSRYRSMLGTRVCESRVPI
ncbi:kinesin-like protein kin-14e [Quercus suber]|uniref:Kinesin-like protein kin-14e n=1 Tax=Quercus suber TaxID=58331 RepID=A0AAW0M1W6_QUESU